MCGVAGVVGRRGTRELEELARRLTTPLTHRGPDGAGCWCSGGDTVGDGWVALGHRRLAIIDLATGAQPMSSEDATIVVSFNGEIYNHRELRVELERRGCLFRTSSDTEVLIHGWREWGISLLERLNGIFAFALADAAQRRVLLARDPAGVKPLYVGVGGGLTWFASELSAARTAGLSRMAADPDALKLYLTFGFVPSPFAAHPDSWKVPPSHYAFVTPDAAGRAPEFFAYSTKVRSSHAPRGRAQWRDALANELDSAIRRQMLSDVPLGTLLSGGVDSSVVTASMAANGAPPQAFAIGFSDGGVNEADAARRAASELRVPLDVVETTRGEYLGGWSEALAQLSEPVANPGLRLVDLLCRHVSRSHKVVLTGQGADEPLGGYPRHLAERLYSIGRRSRRLSGVAARAFLGAEAGRRISRVLATPDIVDRFVQILAVIPPADVDRMVRSVAAPALELARSAVGRWIGGEDDDRLNALLRVDARLSLADDLLIVADHFSMRHGVELRVPFLDLALLELVERMPSSYKVSLLGERKWLYRQAARGLLPKALGDALCGWRARVGRKHGFTVPTTEIFAGGTAALVRSAAWARAYALHDHISVAEGAREDPRPQRALHSLVGWASAVA